MSDEELLARAVTPELLERCRRVLDESKRLIQEFLALDDEMCDTLAEIRTLYAFERPRCT